ncbi:hypothetical protein DFH09DRAFT_1421610 [Mycena vulgaris]|nr:hypothetical protein DFH09DRAFT_1421610 [Mycena vulgaris]
METLEYPVKIERSLRISNRELRAARIQSVDGWWQQQRSRSSGIRSVDKDLKAPRMEEYKYPPTAHSRPTTELNSRPAIRGPAEVSSRPAQSVNRGSTAGSGTRGCRRGQAEAPELLGESEKQQSYSGAKVVNGSPSISANVIINTAAERETEAEHVRMRQALNLSRSIPRALLETASIWVAGKARGTCKDAQSLTLARSRARICDQCGDGSGGRTYGYSKPALLEIYHTFMRAYSWTWRPYGARGKREGTRMHTPSLRIRPRPRICDPAVLGRNSANTVTERKEGQRREEVRILQASKHPNPSVHAPRVSASCAPVVKYGEGGQGNTHELQSRRELISSRVPTAPLRSYARAPGDGLDTVRGSGKTKEGARTDAPSLRRDYHAARPRRGNKYGVHPAPRASDSPMHRLRQTCA